jgi:hypothetical protein
MKNTSVFRPRAYFVRDFFRSLRCDPPAGTSSNTGGNSTANIQALSRTFTASVTQLHIQKFSHSELIAILQNCPEVLRLTQSVEALRAEGIDDFVMRDFITAICGD